MKKILVAFLCICFITNISFAFDPYADEEFEKKSKTKLYCGIAMALIGGFLAYDGFSQEEVDISKPSVDYGGSINAMWIQHDHGEGEYEYYLYTGSGTPEIEPKEPNEKNTIYNTGNVDLTNVTVRVRYRYTSGKVIDDLVLKHNNVDITDMDSEGYFEALGTPDKNLAINEKKEWYDATTYIASENSPYGQDDVVYYEENALKLVNVRVTYDYKKNIKNKTKVIWKVLRV